MKATHKLIQPVHHWSPTTMFDIVRKQMGRSVTEAPDLLNHVGTFHAGVLFTTCEAASGAALAGALLPVIMQTRFVVREARISYLKPAKGTFSAQATVIDDPDVVLNDLLRLGRAEVAVDVCARATDGVVVARATFNWSLKLQEA